MSESNYGAFKWLGYSLLWSIVAAGLEFGLQGVPTSAEDLVSEAQTACQTKLGNAEEFAQCATELFNGKRLRTHSGFTLFSSYKVQSGDNIEISLGDQTLTIPVRDKTTCVPLSKSDEKFICSGRLVFGPAKVSQAKVAGM